MFMKTQQVHQTACSTAPMPSSAISLFGIVSFDEPILCAREALGAVAPVTIGGVPGLFALPGLPDWTIAPDDPLHMPLLPPEDAATWKRGTEPLAWGYPVAYPAGLGRVDSALLRFDVATSSVSDAGTQICAAYDRWRTLFINHLELLTKQRRAPQLRIVHRTDDLDLFCWNEDRKTERPYTKPPAMIHATLPNADHALTPNYFEKICALASAGGDLPLEYQIQLEAYRALRAGDYRKAIIEAAAAAEVALTNSIRAKLQADGVSYAESILNKFRMLGGRLELAELMAITLPDRNLRKDLVEPRNNIIHKADFADIHSALLAVEAADEILQCQPSPLY